MYKNITFVLVRALALRLFQSIRVYVDSSSLSHLDLLLNILCPSNALGLLLDPLQDS